MIVLKPVQATIAPTATKDTKPKAGTAAAKAKATSTAKVHTLKTTIGHNSTLKSRDEAYKVQPLIN